MKPTRINSLVSWMWTGAILIGVSLLFLIRGWFLTKLGMPPVSYRRSSVLDPPMAIAGAVVLFIIGAGIIAGAILAKLRKGP